MSIIGKLKELILGLRSKPLDQDLIRTVPQEVVLEPCCVTIGELQNEPMPSWLADGCKGFEFGASLQIRTPLRVLLRHGELYLKNDGQQPQIVREMWEGVWIPSSKGFEETFRGPDSNADDIDFFRRLDDGFARKFTMASDVGSVLADDYLPFLVALREIVELKNSVEHRSEKLRKFAMGGDWKKYIAQHGGIDTIIEKFFPRFVYTIPKISIEVTDALLKLGLDTPNRIAAASDEALLSIKGIGQSKLMTIRRYCAGIIDNRDANMLDNVNQFARFPNVLRHCGLTNQREANGVRLIV